MGAVGAIKSNFDASRGEFLGKTAAGFVIRPQ